MNFFKIISNLFSKKSKVDSAQPLTAEEKAAKSVELQVPNSKVKRRKQKRGY